MSDLHAVRVASIHPFLHCGMNWVDHEGSISGIGDRSLDKAFLAAFKGFIDRRGLYLVKAKKQIDNEMQEAILAASENIVATTAKDGVTYKFIPVSTPHFGEPVAIRSTK